MATGHRAFRALYYPYSRCLREVDLKRAVLVFDELLFVDPLSRDISEHPGQTPIHNVQIEIRGLVDCATSGYNPKYVAEWRRGWEEKFVAWYNVAETHSFLSSHGIARLVSPANHLATCQEVLKYAVLCDLADDLGKEIGIDIPQLYCLPPRNFGWKLHASRVPAGLLELQKEEDLLHRLLETRRRSAEDIDRTMEADVSGRIRAVLAWASHQIQDAKAGDLILPFDLAYSLILN
jgi:hypothetical protein